MRLAVLFVMVAAAVSPGACSQVAVGIVPLPTGTLVTLPYIVSAYADPNLGYWQLPMAPRWYVAPEFCQYVIDYNGMGISGYHSGEDVPKLHGTPVYACADGIVKHVGDDDMRQDYGYGHVIVIEHYNPRLYPSPRCSLYGHLSHDGMYVRRGQYVRKGQVIGHVGTAREGHIRMGPHLHFHIYKGAFGGDVFAALGPTALWVKSRFENPVSDLINGMGFIDRY